MSKIVPLPDTLINQIAAGEMIERPASIVKELCENAMDAGATDIRVELIAGGVKKIVIADNASGMNAEDLPLALQRHATSKIRSFEDLLQVSSMGFRGEALASIASVADLTINTNTTNTPAHAVSIRVSGGKIGAITPSTRGQGTTMTVQDLFFNIPARRQFLRNEATEAAHCMEALRRLALISPHIAWSATHNGREILNYPIATSHETRWKAVLGETFFSHSRSFQEVSGPINLAGVLVLPSAMAGAVSIRRDSQYWFINGRFVRDKVLMSALKEGYAEMRHDAKVLSFVITVTLPPDMVDVNVSPAKTEVRFRESGAIYQVVRQAVKKALSGAAGDYPAPRLSLTPSSSIHTDRNIQAKINHHGPAWEGREVSRGAVEGYSAPASFAYHPSAQSISATLDFYQQSATPDTLANKDIAMGIEKGEPNNINKEMADNMPPLGYAIGLLHHLYILAQNSAGLVVVDIHAAHERIIFESLKGVVANKDSAATIPAQNLMVPWRMNVRSHEAKLWREHSHTFTQLGLYSEIHDDIPHEEAILLITAVPASLYTADFSALVSELLIDLGAHGHSVKVEEANEALLSTMACHGARRGLQNMSIPQMNALLRQMEDTLRSGTCNHGRPSFAEFPLADFDKFFMRGK